MHTAEAARIGASYDLQAHRYAEHVAGELARPSLDRAALRLFAELVGPASPTLDAGCGPGHISAYLASHGLDVSGMDVSRRLIGLAAAARPEIGFCIGLLTALPAADASLLGVVARHSIIHTRPDQLDAVLGELARVLAPGGRLFVSFFAVEHPDEHGAAFDHAVHPAHRLDPDVVARVLAGHGLHEEVRLTRPPRPGERPIPHAALIARRPSDDS